MLITAKNTWSMKVYIIRRYIITIITRILCRTTMLRHPPGLPRCPPERRPVAPGSRALAGQWTWCQFSFQKKTAKRNCHQKNAKNKKNKGEWNKTFMLKIPFKKKQTTWLPGGIGRDTSWAIDSDVPQWWCVVTLYPRVSVPTLRNGCCSEAQGCEASLLIITTV